MSSSGSLSTVTCPMHTTIEFEASRVKSSAQSGRGNRNHQGKYGIRVRKSIPMSGLGVCHITKVYCIADAMMPHELMSGQSSRPYIASVLKSMKSRTEW